MEKHGRERKRETLACPLKVSQFPENHTTLRVLGSFPFRQRIAQVHVSHLNRDNLD